MSYSSDIRKKAKILLKSYENKRDQCEKYDDIKKKLCRDKWVLKGKKVSIKFLESKLKGCEKDQNPDLCRKSLESAIKKYALKRDEYQERVDCFKTDNPIKCRNEIIKKYQKKQLNENLSTYIDKKITLFL